MKDNLHEEILRQLSLINFDRGKTIIENREIVLSESEWCKSKEAAGVKSLLFQLGFFKIPKSYWVWGCPNYNSGTEAYNDAALSAMRYLTNLLFNEIQYTTLDSFFKVNVLGGKSGGEWKFTKFDQNLIDTLKEQLYPTKQSGLGLDETQIQSRNIYNTFVLQDFYFNYPKLTQNIDLFDGGPWNFLNMFFGSSPGNSGSQINIPVAVSNIKTVNAFKQPMLNRDIESGDVVRKVVDTYKSSSEPNFDSYVSAYHTIIPIISLMLNFLPPAGPVVGSALEMIDAALYEFYDEDPYLAGFTFAMALIPFSELNSFKSFAKLSKIAGTEKKALNEISKKLISQTPETLTSVEKEFMKDILNPKVILPKLKKNFSKILQAGLKSKGAKFVVDLVNEVAKSSGWNNTFMRTIYKIWGITYSYDWWAYNNIGKCSATFNWDELTKIIGVETKKYKGDIAYEKIINDRKNELITQLNPQPFTSSPEECKKLAEIKLMEEAKKIQLDKQRLFNFLLKSTFETMLQKNVVMSDRYKNSYEIEVEMLQSMLAQVVGVPLMGIDYKIENFFDGSKGKTKSSNLISKLVAKNMGTLGNYQNSKLTLTNVSSINKIEIINTIPGDRVVDTIRPMGKKEVTSKKINLSPSFKLKFEYKNGTKKESGLINNNVSLESITGGLFSEGGAKSRVNWGYFDDITKTMVEVYQKNEGLEQTGKVDSKTLSALIYDLTEGATIKNITNLKIDKEEENKKILELALSNLIDNWENTQKEPDPNTLTDEQKKDSMEVVDYWMNMNFGNNMEDQVKKFQLVDTVLNKK
jgi:hypothetical protein